MKFCKNRIFKIFDFLFLPPPPEKIIFWVVGYR
nr:MAG TPA: hypothetical protein [Caudoviricetes sp.]